MKISVVIAAYCGERYITEQLDSLLAQKRLPDEVLIGDDSPDMAVAEKVDEFKKYHPALPFSLKYQKNPETRGCNKNFYSLACECSGDIVFFCDQDDLWLPEKIKILAGELESNPELDAVCCFSTFTDADLQQWKTQDDSEFKALNGVMPDTLFYQFARNAINGAGHNIAVRKKVLSQLPVWDGYFLYDSWIVRSCAMCGSLRFVKKRLTLHRVHGNNFTKHAETNFKRTIFMRTKNSGSAELTRLLAEWKLFKTNLDASLLADKVLPSNKKMLDKCIRYLEKRLQYRSSLSFLRFFLCFILLPDYFLFGNGWRSAVRDMFRL